jgi:hypothetical protein
VKSQEKDGRRKPVGNLAMSRYGSEMQSFRTISGDTGAPHVTPDEHGARIAQHTLPTKSAGICMCSPEMVFHFLRPVFTKDTIRREETVTHDERLDNAEKPTATWRALTGTERRY